MNMYLILSCLFLVTALPGCDPPDTTGEGADSYTAVNLLSASRSGEIDRVVSSYLKGYSYISVGLIGPDGTLLVRSYGSDRIGKTDVYASVSKPVTATIFFSMLENGEIHSVDDPIGLYSDKYKDVMPADYGNLNLTFKHLLSHQSGIPHHDRIWDRGKLKLAFKPGTQAMYSTRGYGVLGEVLCGIAGMNYNHLVRTYIGEPVGAGSFSAPSFLFEAPGGLVRSTISDMVRFAEGVLDHTYVGSALQHDLQWVPYAQDQQGQIGMGWYLNNVGTDSLAVYHAGSNGKPRAFIALRPDQHIGVVLLGKRSSSKGSQLFYQLAMDLIQELRTYTEQ